MISPRGARQERFGGGEGGFGDGFGHRRAARVGVEAVRRVVRVQGDDAVKAVDRQFAFQQGDLRLERFAPELAVEVEARARMPGAVLVAGRVADEVGVNLVAERQHGPGGQLVEKFPQRQRAFGFVAMDGGKNPEPQPIAAAAAGRAARSAAGNIPRPRARIRPAAHTARCPAAVRPRGRGGDRSRPEPGGRAWRASRQASSGASFARPTGCRASRWR